MARCWPLGIVAVAVVGTVGHGDAIADKATRPRCTDTVSATGPAGVVYPDFLSLARAWHQTLSSDLTTRPASEGAAQAALCGAGGCEAGARAWVIELGDRALGGAGIALPLPGGGVVAHGPLVRWLGGRCTLSDGAVRLRSGAATGAVGPVVVDIWERSGDLVEVPSDAPSGVMAGCLHTSWSRRTVVLDPAAPSAPRLSARQHVDLPIPALVDDGPGSALRTPLLRDVAVSPRRAVLDPCGPRSVGSTNGGRLAHGVRLPDVGPDHLQLFPRQCRPGPGHGVTHAWGHPAVVTAVSEVAATVRRRLPDLAKLPIGDLSGPEGGPIPHHLSHQNGLDVDVYFPVRGTGASLAPCTDPPRYEVREVGGGWAVAPGFDAEAAWVLAEAFAARPDVRVIFVGTLLRKRLGSWAKAAKVASRVRRRTMAKLHPVFCRAPRGVQMDSYRNNLCPHDDHLHVRFRCPKDSPACR